MDKWRNVLLSTTGTVNQNLGKRRILEKLLNNSFWSADSSRLAAILDLRERERVGGLIRRHSEDGNLLVAPNSFFESILQGHFRLKINHFIFN